MRALVFDTETTGLVLPSAAPLSRQPSIIEFFGVVVDEDGHSVEEYEQLIHPGQRISSEIEKITGIKNADLLACPRFPTVAGRIKALIESCDLVVAHNLSFDLTMVDNEMLKAGYDVAWPKRRICTVEVTEWMKGKRLKLQDLHQELFGEAFVGAHRARADAEATAKCFVELMKRDAI
jgi:DNA polymerase-3 subunit alpha